MQRRHGCPANPPVVPACLSVAVTIATPFLEMLDQRDAADLVAAGHPVRFRRGTTLTREGDRSRRILVLRTGRVKVSRALPDGREAVLGVRGPGHLIGELAALDGRPRSATVVALEDVTAAALAVEDFERFLVEHPNVAIVLIRSLVDRLRHADAVRTEIDGEPVSVRLARAVERLAAEQGTPQPDGTIHVPLLVTQTELGGMIGASREAVAKALRQLRDQGILTTGRKTIVIIDPDRLRRLGV